MFSQKCRLQILHVYYRCLTFEKKIAGSFLKEMDRIGCSSEPGSLPYHHYLRRSLSGSIAMPAMEVTNEQRKDDRGLCS